MDRTHSSEPLLASDNDGGIDENEDDLPLEIVELKPTHNGHMSEKQLPAALLAGNGRTILLTTIMLEFLQTFDKSGT